MASHVDDIRDTFEAMVGDMHSKMLAKNALGNLGVTGGTQHSEANAQQVGGKTQEQHRTV